MGVTEADIREIEARLSPLLGRKAWGVSLGVGSFVTLEFGEPLPPATGKERPHGEWHLWVFCCAWRLEKGDEVVAGSEDPRTHLATAVKQLDGLALESFEVRAPGFDAVFNFEGGVVLRLFPLIFSREAGEYEHWFLYTPDNHVLTVGPGTLWSYENSSKTRE